MELSKQAFAVSERINVDEFSDEGSIFNTTEFALNCCNILAQAYNADKTDTPWLKEVATGTFVHAQVSKY